MEKEIKMINFRISLDKISSANFRALNDFATRYYPEFEIANISSNSKINSKEKEQMYGDLELILNKPSIKVYEDVMDSLKEVAPLKFDLNLTWSQLNELNHLIDKYTTDFLSIEEFKAKDGKLGIIYTPAERKIKFPVQTFETIAILKEKAPKLYEEFKNMIYKYLYE